MQPATLASMRMEGWWMDRSLVGVCSQFRLVSWCTERYMAVRCWCCQLGWYRDDEYRAVRRIGSFAGASVGCSSARRGEGVVQWWLQPLTARRVRALV